MMNRKDAREMMMKVFYQLDVNHEFGTARFQDLVEEKKTGGQRDYCRRLFQEINAHRKDVDLEISKYSLKWKPDRMAKTDIAILRLGVCEILYLPDIPDSVAVNEAVELAKRYGTDNAPRFINAILGKVVQEKPRAEKTSGKTAEKEPEEEASEEQPRESSRKDPLA